MRRCEAMEEANVWFLPFSGMTHTHRPCMAKSGEERRCGEDCESAHFSSSILVLQSLLLQPTLSFLSLPPSPFRLFLFFQNGCQRNLFPRPPRRTVRSHSHPHPPSPLLLHFATHTSATHASFGRLVFRRAHVETPASFSRPASSSPPSLLERATLVRPLRRLLTRRGQASPSTWADSPSPPPPTSLPPYLISGPLSARLPDKICDAVSDAIVSLLHWPREWPEFAESERVCGVGTRRTDPRVSLSASAFFSFFAFPIQLDACLAQDPWSKVACETAAKTGCVELPH